MLNVDLNFPKKIIKKLDNVQVMLVMDSETKKHELFVPLSIYLNAMDKIDELTNQQANQEQVAQLS